MDIAKSAKAITKKPIYIAGAVIFVLTGVYLLNRGGDKTVITTAGNMGIDPVAIQNSAAAAALADKKAGMEFEAKKLSMEHERLLNDSMLSFERERLAHERGMAEDRNTFELSGLEMAGQASLQSQQMQHDYDKSSLLEQLGLQRYTSDLNHSLSMNTLWSNERVQGAQLEVTKRQNEIDGDLKRMELSNTHDIQKRHARNERLGKVLGFVSKLNPFK